MAHIGMWPVGSPQHASRGGGNECSGERNDVVIGRWPVGRESLGTGNLHPGPFVAHQVEQCLERLLLNPVGGRDASHVIDHERTRHLVEEIGVLRQVFGIEVQHDVPTVWLDLFNEPPEHIEVGCAAEVFDEVESGAAHTGGVERSNVGIGERLIDHRHACVAPVAAAKRIDHRGIVGAVARRLHEHRT